MFGRSGECAGDCGAAFECVEGAAQLVDVQRGLRGTQVFDTGADWREQRERTCAEVGVSDDGGRKIRDDAMGKLVGRSGSISARCREIFGRAVGV